MMKVKDLIAALSEMPPDADVALADDVGGGDVEFRDLVVEWRTKGEDYGGAHLVTFKINEPTIAVDPELVGLVKAVVDAHPGPWKQRDGYGDRGGRFSSIVDATGTPVFDAEFGHLPDEVFNMMLNFPEIAGEIIEVSA